ncbi:MAG: acetyl-CoA carboxylase, carboxyltransferase subunit beta [Bacteroidia bacterium]|nr:acetyl-CoA carboxylase, carboxyltransferase subunit beta [Bacteroidia bacterium]MDW8158285.1 acetyl-CoA carboxylase, carboxyltransferase subunit beta [Bacteroidia bacterium]
MPWFRREKAGIRTQTTEKIEAPDGLWVKCPACKKPTHIKELINNSHVCPYCGYHYKIGSENYFSLLFDNNTYTELDANLAPADPLEFVDSISYRQRIEEAQKKTNLKDALRSAHGKMGNIEVIIACMDFSFIGGSMGSVVGEKIVRASNLAIERRWPLIIISKSGGARMMEGAISLMQMAKTSAHLALLHQAKIPYISVLTDPTTGGVTASFAMLGDFNIAEPKSLIGFAGPRVIRETIGKDLPAGFQSAEFLLEHGFIDFIVERKQLKSKLVTLLQMLYPW